MNAKTVFVVISAFFALDLNLNAALAQMDTRSRPRNPVNDGRALDANPQVGSGGVNQATPQAYQFDYGRRANEIVTGNVSGLARFHVDSPLVASNSFRLSLPSAGLAPFRATSVGLPDVTNGWSTIRPQSYYDPQISLNDAGAIRSGLLPLGTSYLTTPYQAPLLPYERAYQQQLQPPDLNTQPSIVNRPLAPINASNPDPALNAANAISGGNPMSPYSVAAGSSLFGAPQAAALSTYDPGAPSMTRAGAQRSELYAPGVISPRDHDAVAGLSSNRVESDQPLGAGPPPLVSRAGGLSTQSPGMPVAAGQGTLAGESLAAGETALVPGIRSTAYAGGDRFHEMVNAIAAAQKDGSAQTGFIGRGRLNAEQAAAAQQDRQTGASTQPPSGAPAPASDADISELSVAAKWKGRSLDDPVRSFAGTYQGRMNEYMASAEEALKAGEYYSASRLYQLAGTIDPDNPLPLLGRGHALAAAGDYITAVYLLEQGIARFPQIALFELDLPSIVGRHDAFDIRRADLEKRLAVNEDYRLRFLLGYLEVYSGLREKGLRDLETAASHAPAGGIVSRFPALLSGREPIPPVENGER